MQTKNPFACVHLTTSSFYFLLFIIETFFCVLFFAVFCDEIIIFNNGLLFLIWQLKREPPVWTPGWAVRFPAELTRNHRLLFVHVISTFGVSFCGCIWAPLFVLPRLSLFEASWDVNENWWKMRWHDRAEFSFRVSSSFGRPENVLKGTPVDGFYVSFEWSFQQRNEYHFWS